MNTTIAVVQLPPSLSTYVVSTSAVPVYKKKIMTTTVMSTNHEILAPLHQFFGRTDRLEYTSTNGNAVMGKFNE
jgi:hypothetical protein